MDKGVVVGMQVLGIVRFYLNVFVLFLRIVYIFSPFISGADKILDSSIEDHPLSEQDSIQKSPLSETLDVKPSDMTSPRNFFHI